MIYVFSHIHISQAILMGCLQVLRFLIIKIRNISLGHSEVPYEIMMFFSNFVQELMSFL